MAAGIAFTAISAKYILHTKIDKKQWWTIAAMLFGVTLLSAMALPNTAIHMTHATRAILVWAPLVLLISSIYYGQEKTLQKHPVMLAFIGGITFSGSAIISRVIMVPHPILHILADPLLWSFVAYNMLGMLTYSIALQKGLITSVNATLFSSELLVPAVAGLIFFGDKARNGSMPLLLIGSLIVLGATVVLA